MASVLGDIQFPKSASGLCFESDHGLLRVLPAKRDPAMQSPEHFPTWLSQRRDGESGREKKHRQWGRAPEAGQPSVDACSCLQWPCSYPIFVS
eukprot:8919095-Pyramimonas_sp.AAC.1